MARQPWRWQRRWNKWGVLGALLIVGLAAKTYQASLVPVTAVPVRVGSLALTIAASGEVGGIAADLAFPINGKIVSIFVEEGDRVGPNQVLARVDAASDPTATSTGRDVICSPFLGTVVNIYQRPGSGTAPGMPVLRVVEEGAGWVTAFVDSEDAAHLRPGLPMTCRAGGYLARAWQLEVVSVGREAVPRPDVPGSARQIRVRLKPLERDFGLPTGTPVDVDGEAPVASNVLLAPATAVVREGGDSYVWRINGERAERVKVATGATNFRDIELLNGLATGDLVVTEGKARVTAEARLRVTVEDQPEP